MTREEIYSSCLEEMGKGSCLLMELPTGFGKSKCAIDLVNHLCDTTLKGRKVKVLLLVAKRVHKETWKDEIAKWGGLKADTVIMECYESLRKHTDEDFDIILCDEVHHIQSEARLELLSMVSFTYLLGLSATIPRNLKWHFRNVYKARVVSCNLEKAIESEVLPEPRIMLMPMQLDNTAATETIVLNKSARSKTVVTGSYKDIRKLKQIRNQKVIVTCTQQQKIFWMNSLILNTKNRYQRSRSESAKVMWLYQCGQRLEMLSSFKKPMIADILKHLDKERTITFCKSIEQCEELGSNCIHSRNPKSDEIYNDFNRKKINHITAVNILNENANLVDCKYAVFCNLSSSEVVMPQRIGRSLRHREPVIIIPYYIGTREEEIVQKMLEGFNEEFVTIINSVKDI